MKTSQKNFILILICCLLYNCWPRNADDDFISSSNNFQYEAVVMKRSEFENSTQLLPQQTIVNSGKIYVRNGLLLVNEVNQGFHLIDNSDPANPTNVAFLKILGSTDVSIKNDMFYVNNATDLLAIKTDIDNRQFNITKRVKDAFPELQPPNGNGFHNTAVDEVIVNWILNDN